jgi:hypothetical protein
LRYKTRPALYGIQTMQTDASNDEREEPFVGFSPAFPGDVRLALRPRPLTRAERR